MTLGIDICHDVLLIVFLKDFKCSVFVFFLFFTKDYFGICNSFQNIGVWYKFDEEYSFNGCTIILEINTRIDKSETDICLFSYSLNFQFEVSIRVVVNDT